MFSYSIMTLKVLCIKIFQRLSLTGKGEVGRQWETVKQTPSSRYKCTLSSCSLAFLGMTTLYLCILLIPRAIGTSDFSEVKNKIKTLHTIPQLLTSSAEQPRLKSSHHTSQVDDVEQTRLAAENQRSTTLLPQPLPKGARGFYSGFYTARTFSLRNIKWPIVLGTLFLSSCFIQHSTMQCTV